MAKHNVLGTAGEEAACGYLMKKGYQIKARNWRFINKEIDIVAVYNNELVIVEVKTRSSFHLERPEDAVTASKIKNLIEAAHYYINQNNSELETRFDVISIVVGKSGAMDITHFERAFIP